MRTELVRLCVRRGFFWGPSPEIYGGIAGFYDLGPLGSLMKRKIENFIRLYWRNCQFWEIECPTIEPEIVWKASGHIDRFTDYMVECSSCGFKYRADHFLEEHGISVKSYSVSSLRALLISYNLRCPRCGAPLSDVHPQNLMLETKIFPNIRAFLRPETATTTYLLFRRLYRFFRRKLPFGVFQIGRAYRNEISPRRGLIRMREFTQAEAQIFVTDDVIFTDFVRKNNVKLPLLPIELQEKGHTKPQQIAVSEALEKEYLSDAAFAYIMIIAYLMSVDLGLKKELLRIRQHSYEERAHYVQDAWDLEFYSRESGWLELCGIHDRGTYDLERHSRFSGVSLEVPTADGLAVIPRVLEIAYGIERIMYALLEQSYTDEGGRVYLRLPNFIAPIEVGVLPLTKKEALTQKAREIYRMLLQEGFVTYYDESGSIGRRYRRLDEIGCPFAITCDARTLSENVVTIRNRDTTTQEIISVDKIVPYLRERLKFPISIRTWTLST